MDIDNLSGHDFEDLTEELIKKLGFITEERKRSADGGIDIRAISEQPIFKGLYIIQCKRHNKNIGEAIIRDLFGVVSSERANKGILITNSKFTKSAEDFAKNKPIELIDGTKLLELLEENINDKGAKRTDKYELTLKYLEEGSKNIRDRRQAIMGGRLYIGSKYFRTGKSYFDFITEKMAKLTKILPIFGNQSNNINNIWKKFSEGQNNYINIKELKNQCSELINTIDLLQKEQEEIISAIPPDNYHFTNINNSLRNAYNQLFDIFFTFVTELSLMVNDPDNPRIAEKIKDGKVLLEYEPSGIDFEEISREIEKYNDDLVRQYSVTNKQKSRCFVATVVYGDANAIEVIKLRCWRDEVLSKIFGGNIIINLYYFIGSHYANLINRIPILKKITKTIIDKIIYYLPS